VCLHTFANIELIAESDSCFDLADSQNDELYYEEDSGNELDFTW